MWKKAIEQTRREQRSALDGVNLFFGALLGANLGSLNNLGLGEYAALVMLLAGAVITLRVFTTSERRGYAFMLLGLYIVVVSQFLLWPPRGLDGLSLADRQRIAVTMAIWLGTTLMTYYAPIRDVPRRTD
jgi:glucose dehydrogenase